MSSPGELIFNVPEAIVITPATVPVTDVLSVLTSTLVAFGMDMDEAIGCAQTVGAKHSTPYHMAPGKLFDRKRAEMFDVPNRLIIAAGEEIVLE